MKSAVERIVNSNPLSCHDTRRAQLVRAFLFAIAAVWVGTIQAQTDHPTERQPVQVYILAGQSNMEGKGSVVTVEKQLNDPARRDRFAHLKHGEGWVQRNDVWIHYLGNHGRRSGPLTIGYGTSKQDDTRLFGPELGFGWTVGDAIDAPVLIIKTAWGGKSIDRDFRPPSRGFPPSLEETYERTKRRNPDLSLEEYKQGYGHYYRLMIDEVHHVLGDLKSVMPEYEGQGYELAGFVWFQGWNDQYAPTSVEDYQENLAALIRDVRKEFGVPRLPVVIGAMGHNGEQQKGKIKQIADAQAAVAEMPEFQGTVTTVRTAEYWDTEAEEAFQKYWADEENRDVEKWREYGNDRGYHYFGSPVFFYNVGVAFGEAMLRLQGIEPKHEDTGEVPESPKADVRNSSATAVAGQDWHRFLGPNGNAARDGVGLPDHWSATDNIAWRTLIDGRGWSSPIVVDGKVYLTTVTTDGESKKPQTGTDFSNEYVAELMKQGLSEDEVKERVMSRDIELPNEVNLHYWMICLDLESGSVLWRDEFHTGHPPGGRHRKNSFSSESAVSDGESVFVHVSNLGLFAWDLKGNRQWTTPLESYPIYLDFGTGSSPVIHDNQLIILNDNETDSFIASFDKRTGALLWRTERQPPAGERPGLPRSGWTTPLIWENSIRTEIVAVGPGAAISYDLQGQELWRLEKISVAPAASSFAIGDRLILNGGRGRPVFCIRAGATGDITLDDDALTNEFVVWSRPRAGTYIPTAVAYDGGLYIVADNGIIRRLDLGTGEETFKARLNSKGADFTATPWAANGRVFCLSEQGDTYVLKADRDYELLHVNPLGEFSMASPAIVGDRLLIRTERALYCIWQQD